MFTMSIMNSISLCSYHTHTLFYTSFHQSVSEDDVDHTQICNIDFHGCGTKNLDMKVSV